MRGGSQRWLDVGIKLQPSEFMKPVIVLACARFYDMLPPNETRRFGAIWPAALLVGIPAALIAKQPDLGTALMVCGGGVVVMFLAGVPMRLFIGGALALSVAAGESPVSALDRVVRRSHGALSDDLAQVLARIRTGEPVGAAFESLARSTGLPIVARFATGITVAMERGTPLADVLHAQAADVREAGRRLLIETAARKEIAMMAPVVFFVLPVTILFAFYPGVLGLRLTTP